MPIIKDADQPMRRRFFQPLPLAVWAMVGACAIAGAFGSNPILTPCAILLVPLLATLLWFPGEPPALLFACLMQWLQAAAAIFYTDWHGVSLVSAFGGPELAQATWLSLLGILVLALGMRLVLLKSRPEIGVMAHKEARTIRVDALFAVYLTINVVLFLSNRAGSGIGGLQQAINAAGSLRWVFVFLIAYAALTQRRHYATLSVVVVLEFATGLLGFFSSFKSVFFVLLVALPAAGHFFRGARLAQSLAVFAVLLGLVLVWTAIKVEYREFLSQGTGQQVIMVSVPERIEKLTELVTNLDRESAEQAFEDVVLRISYVNYFALTLVHVPSVMPHERGALWWGAIKHVLMPRMFFPDKPVINDSERTAYYSGVQVAGEEQGTSISIGYIGESYIDFGRAGMFAPILLLGMFYGLIYRYFVYHLKPRLIGYALATSILVFGAYNVETSNIKLIGGNLMSFIVFALFARFCAPLLWPVITHEPVTAGANRRKRRSKPVKPDCAAT